MTSHPLIQKSKGPFYGLRKLRYHDNPEKPALRGNRPCALTNRSTTTTDLVTDFSHITLATGVLVTRAMSLTKKMAAIDPIVRFNFQLRLIDGKGLTMALEYDRTCKIVARLHTQTMS
jgi:hypothetical protein